MSLETVVEDIREEARARAEEIRAETEAEAETILEEAEADADTLLAERKRAVEDRVEREREQAISSATLEAKQQRLSLRRDLLADLRESVESEIRSLSEARREELTRPLLADAVKEYPEEYSLEVTGSPQDESLLTELCDEFDQATVAGTVECLGGVRVSSEQSRVTIDNTFDAILEEMWEDNVRELSALLFESEQ